MSLLALAGGMKWLGVIFTSKMRCQSIAGLHSALNSPVPFYTLEQGEALWKCVVQEHNTRTLVRGPFLERPGNLTGPKSYFEMESSRKVGCVLICNEVYFVSLADNFTVQFSNLLKPLSRMKNKTA